MTDATRTTSQNNNWTNVQAYTLAVTCLLAGVLAGWLVRGSQSPAAAMQVASAQSATSSSDAATPTPEQLQHMADTQAAPLLERLKTDPNNVEVLANVGNIYYDTQQFPTAIQYYERALQQQPANTGVRTDLATAYWYLGNPDTAIQEFNKALSYEPTKPNTLFNLGIVRWQGKMDVAGAVAAWQKLLDTNPSYENKSKVLELIAQAKKHSSVKPGTQARPLPQS
ncbi:MAG: tetratricopeptide repeat protein [Acidobacteriia bacterium]|nr:tetratricopeptide repeat protein [Terriglobia bacterium]